MEQVFKRTQILTNHLLQSSPSSQTLSSNACLSYSPPELSENYAFDIKDMRKLIDRHNLEERDWLFGLMKQSKLFNPKVRGGKVFVSPDYNQSMEQQREMTLKRIEYLLEKGAFKGWLTEKGEDIEMRKFAGFEVCSIYDHSLFTKLGVHFFLWGGAIQFFGTKHHHDKWLRDTENYSIKGCFAMTELGHGSNVRGLETVTTYDSNTGEFVINTPCESAQKYWIGGAANHATHTVVFSQLHINGTNQGVHAFIVQIRDADGYICPNIRIVDCGHKIGLNGVDNGRIWFDNVRVPRENLLNSVADVSPDGKYLSSIENPDQRFAAFMAPLTVGRVNIAISSVYQSKECREACGGQGLKTENRVGQLKGEYDVQSTFEGDNLILMQQVSKALFAEYMAAQKRNKVFKGLGLEHMNKPCPVIPLQLTSTTLRCSQFQMDALCLRERDLLNRFVADVSKCKAKGESNEQAFLMCYELAQDLGKAFSDRAIFQTFVDAETTLPAGSLKDVLGTLRSLYALICIEDVSFLQYGYLSVDNGANVRREITKLCTELRPHALALVSSFGIPDAFLGPIAFNWIEANAWSSV
ncbi:hypothetical protein ES319_D01G020800v1 [Gossypium barbadense]|uniref:Acyl-coenzyme A oxidase n=1 Tax=Gossypium barbadense TaxID=3634 RepID=A0A5J5SIZ3_GOSBA|nr:hypothetical protein ES319_D01G020800v1 [Gossypium barbadense]